MSRQLDLQYMQQALALAEQAAAQDEVPVGALVVAGGEIVGQGYNQREYGRDATLHAEMIAIREACATMGGWRLPGATLYVTLEPCPMCAGALVNASDPKAGAAGSVLDITRCAGLNHQLIVERGLLAEEAAFLLKSFFARKRC